MFNLCPTSAGLMCFVEAGWSLPVKGNGCEKIYLTSLLLQVTYENGSWVVPVHMHRNPRQYACNWSSQIEVFRAGDQVSRSEFFSLLFLSRGKNLQCQLHCWGFFFTGDIWSCLGCVCDCHNRLRRSGGAYREHTWCQSWRSSQGDETCGLGKRLLCKRGSPWSIGHQLPQLHLTPHLPFHLQSCNSLVKRWWLFSKAARVLKWRWHADVVMVACLGESTQTAHAEKQAIQCCQGGKSDLAFVFGFIEEHVKNFGTRNRKLLPLLSFPD